MKELIVISGKGGTGKTSIVASFAALASNPVLADCDVDAADLHLVVEPRVRQENPFVGGVKARILPDMCVECGQCRDHCRFDAVIPPDGQNPSFRIDPSACEGCGVCERFCPTEAIVLEDAVNGRWFISDTRFGPMVHAELGIAEENSGKLVSLLRKQARDLAGRQGRNLLLVDGSPGIGCPVIASITGADLALVVTEPTLSGRHDLQRIVELTRHFNVPCAVCINKADINPEMAAQIAAEAAAGSISVLAHIPYDNAVTQAQMAGRSLIEHSDGPASQAIRQLWDHTLAMLNSEDTSANGQ